MYIIFLDIDGPVISNRSFFSLDVSSNNLGMMRRFDKNTIGVFNFITNFTDTKIVISSVHRLTKERLWCDLDNAGFDFSGLHKDWRIDVPIGDRSKLIQKWLDDHHDDVNGYICVDDEVLSHPQILVDINEGFTYNNLIRLCYYLYHKGPHDIVRDNASKIDEMEGV